MNWLIFKFNNATVTNFEITPPTSRTIRRSFVSSEEPNMMLHFDRRTHIVLFTDSGNKRAFLKIPLAVVWKQFPLKPFARRKLGWFLRNRNKRTTLRAISSKTRSSDVTVGVQVRWCNLESADNPVGLSDRRHV